MQRRQIKYGNNQLTPWLRLPGVVLCGLLILLLLSACTNNNYAPIYNLERPKTVTKGVHTVRRGETLYAIAWRYGRDYRELARANGIRWPYTIYLGQRISLYKSAPPASAPSKTTQVAKKPQQRVVQPKPAPQPVVTKGPISWRWPVKGAIVGRFNGVSNKGIDIKGKAGQTVRAAADGVVVYAGSGLIGYGNLVIIKHSQTFLSAYAHNKKVLVAEKNKVKAGQKIAEIGSSGASENKLHFEIRKNGKPVNPLWYLPK
ncbi:Lipoprotein NlpD [gamma proteobacterium IMCC2047]|nr:Lipoprotein NlpD [gamma proteobacterium IMCC2047]